MPLVRIRREGAAAVLTLDRPEKLNALSTDVERDLAAVLDAEEVSSSRAIVIEGEGQAFSAGADVNEMREQTPDAILSYYRATGTVYERIASTRQPTVAAIHGYCLGGGLELSMACDLRIAARSAVFGLPEIELGILPSSGGTVRLVRALGVARATELILSRRRFAADDALRFGVVSEVVDDGDASRRALELATDLASLPPLAVEVTKRAIAAAAET
ncbi:MAG: enoyl-CoA hydratase/isomerase family protein, partial [Actinomycetota bacterium]